jgi:hypothetical protein
MESKDNKIVRRFVNPKYQKEQPKKYLTYVNGKGNRMFLIFNHKEDVVLNGHEIFFELQQTFF